MSRTTRKDQLDIEPKRPDHVFMGTVIPATPTAKEVSKAHRDGKPHHKPGKRAKEYLHKGRKAKVRKTLAKVVDDPDAAPLPVEARSDVWNYN